MIDFTADRTPTDANAGAAGDAIEAFLATGVSGVRCEIYNVDSSDILWVRTNDGTAFVAGTRGVRVMPGERCPFPVIMGGAAAGRGGVWLWSNGGACSVIIVF